MRQPSAKKTAERVKNAEDVLRKYADTDLNAESVSAFVSELLKVYFPSGKIFTEEQEYAQDQSCRHLLSRKASYSLQKNNTWNLFANMHFIIDGMPIPEWDGSVELSDATILGVQRIKTPPGRKPCIRIKLKLKTGICAGISGWSTISQNLALLFLDKFSGTREYKCAVEEISGMQARVCVEATSNNELRINKIECTEAQKQENKKLAEARSDVRKCKRGIPCNACKNTVYQCP